VQPSQLKSSVRSLANEGQSAAKQAAKDQPPLQKIETKDSD